MATTYTDCITFTGETSDFTLKATYKEWDGTVEYSTNHNTWTVWNGTEISSSGKKLYLRGSGNTKFYTSNGAWLSLSARAACSGNIQTLLQYNNPPTSIPARFCYECMFCGCTSLTAAPELPATTLADNCYQEMFRGCSSLTKAPALPATTLASHCYQYMFYDCTNLTTAPELPATTLADYCYNAIFYYCTSLKISTTQSSDYPTAWRIPSSGTISSTATHWNTDMLYKTGGTFKSNPSKNTTYYGAWTVVKTYNITYNLTNCTGASSNPTTIDEGTTATLSFTLNDGYSFPDTITVSGVESYTWDKSTGTLTLTNATSDVSITITCIVAYPKINSFTYYGKQINKINNKPIRYVHYSGNTYEMVYALQLATPQNVTANGTTVSWDEVENATSYAVLADGSEIGTVEVAVTDELAGTWLFNDTLDFSSLRLSQDDSISWSVNFTELGYDGVSNAPNRIIIYYGIIGYDDEGNDVIGYKLDYPYVPPVGFPEPYTAYHSIYADGFVGWQIENSKTITITSKLSEVTNGDALLAWLQANATKQ